MGFKEQCTSLGDLWGFEIADLTDFCNILYDIFVVVIVVLVLVIAFVVGYWIFQTCPGAILAWQKLCCSAEERKARRVKTTVVGRASEPANATEFASTVQLYQTYLNNKTPPYDVFYWAGNPILAMWCLIVIYMPGVTYSFAYSNYVEDNTNYKLWLKRLQDERSRTADTEKTEQYARVLFVDHLKTNEDFAYLEFKDENVDLLIAPSVLPKLECVRTIALQAKTNFWGFMPGLNPNDDHWIVREFGRYVTNVPSGMLLGSNPTIKDKLNADVYAPVAYAAKQAFAGTEEDFASIEMGNGKTQNKKVFVPLHMRQIVRAVRVNNGGWMWVD